MILHQFFAFFFSEKIMYLSLNSSKLTLNRILFIGRFIYKKLQICKKKHILHILMNKRVNVYSTEANLFNGAFLQHALPTNGVYIISPS